MKVIEKDYEKAILITRLSIGVLMLLHGIPKVLHGVGFIEGMLAGIGLPKFFAYGVFIGEIVAPLMIIVGYRTRLASVVFFVNCIVAILLVHSGDLFSMGKHGGWAVELLGLFMFGSLSLIFSGGGKYSVSSKHILD